MNVLCCIGKIGRLFPRFRNAVLEARNTDLQNGCRPATRIDLNPIAENQAELFLELRGVSSSRFLNKSRKNESREPLAAIKQSRNGSGGSAKMAQSVAATLLGYLIGVCRCETGCSVVSSMCHAERACSERNAVRSWRITAPPVAPQ